MKRSLKFLLSISSLATAITASATLVTSCTINDLKPSNKEINEKDQRDNSPASKNDNDQHKSPIDDSSSNSSSESNSISINSKSISLSNIGSLLPSQYLKSTTNNLFELSDELITKNFDNSKISNISYVLDSLDDSKGTLSLRMNYKENNVNKSFLFEFNNLLSVNENKSFNLQFDQSSDKSKLLDLHNVLETKIHNKDESNNLIKTLKENDINLKLLQGGSSLPLDYLEVDKIDVSGFKETWFTSPNKIDINLDFKNPKINYFVKNSNDSQVIKKTFTLPTNTNKKLRLTFKSAMDYYLSKITANNSYKDDKDKYAEYYYYDLYFNRGNNRSSQKLGNDIWLSNVVNEVDYNNKKFMYKVDYANDYSSSIDDNGSLNINIIMTCENDTKSSTPIVSTTHKTINLNFFKKHIDNVFRYGDDGTEGKFWFNSDASYYESNMNKLKKQSIKLLSAISKSHENEVLFLKNEIPIETLVSIANQFQLMFSNDQLIKNQVNSESYYSNEQMAIDGYLINKDDIYLVFDKSYNVFKIRLKLTISSEGLKNLDESNYMNVMITKPGKSLDDLKKK